MFNSKETRSTDRMAFNFVPKMILPIVLLLLSLALAAVSLLLPESCWALGASVEALDTEASLRITAAKPLAAMAGPDEDRYVLVILVAGEGSVTKSPSQPLYYHGDEVTLTAYQAPGWSFSHWSGDVTVI